MTEFRTLESVEREFQESARPECHGVKNRIPLRSERKQTPRCSNFLTIQSMKPTLQNLAAICLTTSVLIADDPAPTPATPDFNAMRAEVEALDNINEPPKYEVLDRADATPNLKPIFYSGLDYQGKPTTVFAWLGVPENTDGKKVPAVVLAHGGGGAASKDCDKGQSHISTYFMFVEEEMSLCL